MDKRRTSEKEERKMAQVFQATPVIKGLDAVKLIQKVMTSKPDMKKIEKLEKISSRINSYKK